jgi:hypothetical protein
MVVRWQISATQFFYIKTKAHTMTVEASAVNPKVTLPNPTSPPCQGKQTKLVFQTADPFKRLRSQVEAALQPYYCVTDALSVCLVCM